MAHTHIDHINHPPPPTLLYFITRIATLVEKEIFFFDWSDSEHCTNIDSKKCSF